VLKHGNDTLTLRFDCKPCEMHVVGRLRPNQAAVHCASADGQQTGTTEGDVRPLQQVTQDFFQRSLDSADWQTWVAEAPGSPAPVAIGTMALWLRPPYPGNPGGLDAYLLNMYTAPAQRGQGAARGIVAAALEWARQRGVPKVVLHATAQGRALYEAFGFTGSAAYMECRLEPAA
jgi:GNAT superfamily N-acetyltransferase